MFLEAARMLQIDVRYRDDLALLTPRDGVDRAIECPPHPNPSTRATAPYREKSLMTGCFATPVMQKYGDAIKGVAARARPSTRV